MTKWLMFKKILAFMGVFLTLLIEIFLCMSYGRVAATVALKYKPYKFGLIGCVLMLLCAVVATILTSFVCYNICEKCRKGLIMNFRDTKTYFTDVIIKELCRLIPVVETGQLTVSFDKEKNEISYRHNDISLTFEAGNSLTYLLVTSINSLFGTKEETLYTYNYETEPSRLESEVVPRIKAVIRQFFSEIL